MKKLQCSLDTMNFKLFAVVARYCKEEKEGIQAMCKIMEEIITDEKKNATIRMLERGKLLKEEILEDLLLPVFEVCFIFLRIGNTLQHREVWTYESGKECWGGDCAERVSICVIMCGEWRNCSVFSLWSMWNYMDWYDILFMWL